MLSVLIFVVKQAVPATFIDVLQALTLQSHSEIVKMQYRCIIVEICAKTIRGHPYISLPIGNDNDVKGLIEFGPSKFGQYDSKA